MKCLVRECPNHDHEGTGVYIIRKEEYSIHYVGFLCNPCMQALRGYTDGNRHAVDRIAVSTYTKEKK